jgi:phytoene/squalene synthetase
MKALFDDVSIQCSKITTQRYSTSFSSGIRFLDKGLHDHIYSIYGFVRSADEIVDSFHGYDKQQLLDEFKTETRKAVERKISLNPILNSFQHTVNTFNIDAELIESFFESMETDLHTTKHTEETYLKYIIGSAEVVGLMCLKVFTGNNAQRYESLKYSAMRLGSAFQKVNFLRDVQADCHDLGRMYLPGINFLSFSDKEKRLIEQDISKDFDDALEGIRSLPAGARKGVYLAYSYYKNLFLQIKRTPTGEIMSKRIRVSNYRKALIMISSVVRNKINML